MTIRRRLLSVGAIVSIVAAVTLQAQHSDPAVTLRAQLDRIFKEHAYDPPRFGPATWLPDGTAYAVVERSKDTDGGSEIVRYDAATGARTVLVAASRLVPPTTALPKGKPPAALDIDDYAWSNDGRRLLIFTNTRKCGARTRAATTGSSTSPAARSGKSAATRPSRR